MFLGIAAIHIKGYVIILHDLHTRSLVCMISIFYILSTKFALLIIILCFLLEYNAQLKNILWYTDSLQELWWLYFLLS